MRLRLSVSGPFIDRLRYQLVSVTRSSFVFDDLPDRHLARRLRSRCWLQGIQVFGQGLAAGVCTGAGAICCFRGLVGQVGKQRREFGLRRTAQALIRYGPGIKAFTDETVGKQ